MDSRSKILNAASELFLEGGVAALSVRAISKRAGLSTIGIYSHFQGKQGILDALYIQGFNYVYEAMDVDPGDRVSLAILLEATDGYLRVAEQHEAHYRLIFGESDAGYEPSEEAKEAADRAFARLVAGVGAYLQSIDSTADRVVAALDLWAIVHGYVSISHHARATHDRDWRSLALRAVELHMRALS